jgi:hypothetical protein
MFTLFERILNDPLVAQERKADFAELSGFIKRGVLARLLAFFLYI